MKHRARSSGLGGESRLDQHPSRDSKPKGSVGYPVSPERVSAPPTYRTLTAERFACLRTVENHGGRMNHDHASLAPFCDDASTLSRPDVFNQCHDAGWLISRHDGFLDISFVEITPAGRAVLTSGHHSGEKS